MGVGCLQRERLGALAKPVDVCDGDCRSAPKSSRAVDVAAPPAVYSVFKRSNSAGDGFPEAIGIKVFSLADSDALISERKVWVKTK